MEWNEADKGPGAGMEDVDFVPGHRARDKKDQVSG
jgi:hypothetical protein